MLRKDLDEERMQTFDVHTSKIKPVHVLCHGWESMRALYIRFLFAYDGPVGINRRQAEIEIALAIRDAKHDQQSSTPVIFGIVLRLRHKTEDAGSLRLDRPGNFSLRKIRTPEQYAKTLPEVRFRKTRTFRAQWQDLEIRSDER